MQELFRTIFNGMIYSQGAINTDVFFLRAAGACIILLFSWSVGPTQALALDTLPSIHLQRLIDHSSTHVPALQSQYRLCVSEKQQAQNLYHNTPKLWALAKDNYSAEYQKNIAALPTKEPDWAKEKVGYFAIEEIFSGDRYARIKTTAKYRITDNGLCQLSTVYTQRQAIDTGDYWYRIKRKSDAMILTAPDATLIRDLDNVVYVYETANRSISPTLERQRSQTRLRQQAQDNPKLAQVLAGTLETEDNHATPQSRPDNWQQIDPELIQRLQNAFELSRSSAPNVTLPRANDNHFAAGQACDWVESKKVGARVCYWQTAHHYPSVMQRPIILRKVYQNNSEVADRFTLLDSVPDDVFQPPKHIPVEVVDD